MGYIAAMLGPKNKIGKYIRKAGVALPADIPLEQWDTFHDLIVYAARILLTSSFPMNALDWDIPALYGD